MGFVDGDSETPSVVDPCGYCGRKLVRIADLFAAPSSIAEAAMHWKDCVATQTGRWAWCARTVKGHKRVPFPDRRHETSH